MEVARKVMEDSCKDFFASLKKTEKRGFLGRSRKSVDVQLSQRLEDNGACEIKDVVNLVNELKSEWKIKHGKIHRNFEILCETLHAHRTAFKCVPSNNLYVQSLAGGLSMIVEASVTHGEVAEQLSASMAHLFRRASTCSSLVQMSPNSQMLYHLGEIYRQLFEFIGHTAKWFMKKRVARFFDSFNSEVIPAQEKAHRNIERSLTLLKEVSGVQDTGKITHVYHSVDHITDQLSDLQRSVDDLRRKYQYDGPPEIGARMNAILVAIAGQLSQREIEGLGEIPELRRVETQISIAPSPSDVLKTSMSRTDAEKYLVKLDRFIHSSDGVALAQSHGVHLADTHVIYRLSQWMQNSKSSEKLCVEFPWEHEEENSARQAALGVILIAAQARAPFLSYICHVPDDDQTHQSLSPPRAGLLSMVYCLIRQLLRFRPGDDCFTAEEQELKKLDGDSNSWQPALKLLGKLLEQTPVLRYVIIEGIQMFETGDAETECRELINLLLRHINDQHHPKSILFTTSGSSEVLADVIEPGDRELTESSSRTVERRGEELDFILSMS